MTMPKRRSKRANVILAAGAAGLLAIFYVFALGLGHAQTASSRTYPETGKTVRGRFLEYWDRNGGLPQQGFPISAEMWEVSETNGRTYLVQYFERAIFELHPENRPPYDVLLSLLGVFEYKKKYPRGAPNQVANTSAGSVLYRETGKRVGGRFLEYWRTHGGLPQQGYPISDEFTEVSELNGKPYKVQYFERAVFEYHPENRPPYDVLLSQLGTYRYRAIYQGPNARPTVSAPTVPAGGGAPTPVGTAEPPPVQTGVPPPVPTGAAP